MELQLHEQYAINNNANLGSVVVLLAAMIGVFWGYGYIFIHSTNNFIDFENSCFLYCNCCENYSLDAFVFTAIASSIVIHIMRKICIYQGYAQRYEQFITFAIRCKHFTSLFVKDSKDDKLSNENRGIFSEEYHPFNKKKNSKATPNNENITTKIKRFLKELFKESNQIRPIQGLFGEFVKILNMLLWVIIGGVGIKLIFNIISNYHEWNYLGVIEIVGFGIISVVLYIRYRFDLEKKIKKYNDLEKEYEPFNPKQK